MTGLRICYRMAVLAFFGAVTYHPALRQALLYGKWAFLGLLLIAALSARTSAGRGGLDGATLLLIAFVGAGMVSFAEGVSTGNSLYQLLSVVFVLITASRLALAWQSEQARSGMLEEIVVVARIVVWSSMLMLLAGLNFARAQSRFGGWADNPNSLGAMMFLVWPAVLHRALHRPGWSPASDRVLAVLTLVLLAASGSRAAVLGVLVSTLVLFAVSGRMHARTAAGALLLILLGFIFSGPLGEFIRSTPGLNRFAAEEVVEYVGGAEGATFKASGREAAWAVATRLIGERPWGGYGWGSEAVLLPMFKAELITHDGGNVHNAYLSLLLQVGLLGAAPVLLCFLLALGRGLARVRRLKAIQDPRALPTTVLLATFCGALVHASFESSLFAVGNLVTVIFWPTAFLLLRSDAPLTSSPAPARATSRAPTASAATSQPDVRVG